MDLLYEEPNEFIGNSYDGDYIAEWNINGLSDYQIRQVIFGMLMYASTFVAKNTHLRAHDATIAIIAGFSSSLHGWWDNYLDQNRLEDLLSVIDLSAKGRPEDEQKPNDTSVCTLVTSILDQFTGLLRNKAKRTRSMLQKLRFPSLTHF